MKPSAYLTRAAQRSRGIAKRNNFFRLLWRPPTPGRASAGATTYQLTDRLHDGRTARVSGDEIAATVSAWLAELDVCSPLADDLGRAVRTGNWPAAYAISEFLSVEVVVAA